MSPTTPYKVHKQKQTKTNNTNGMVQNTSNEYHRYTDICIIVMWWKDMSDRSSAKCVFDKLNEHESG
jgi:hypothetical protein